MASNTQKPSLQKPPHRATTREASEERRYPRANMRIKARILVPGSKGRTQGLEAVLETRDVSMTGVFFASTFFLRVGTAVVVELNLQGDKRTVVAEGMIVREERGDSGKGSRSGFAVHFTGFVDDSAIVLASLFLAPRVRRYVEAYLKRPHKKSANETERLTDVVVGWELAKTQQDDLWAQFNG